MLKEYIPSARRRDAEFSFYFVKQNAEGALEKEVVGAVHALRRSGIDLATLASLNFSIGNFMIVEISFSLK